MKKIFKMTFFICLAFILLLVFLCVISTISANRSLSSSVGIIGGADGPTAIFVSRSLLLDSPAIFFFGGVTVLLVASAIGWIVAKKK